MDYGNLLGRAWNIVWEHKFLILLGVLVALTGTSSLSSGRAWVAPQQGQEWRWPQEWNVPQQPDGSQELRFSAIRIIVAVILSGIALVIGAAVWALSTLARGALVAGAGTIDAGAPSTFGQAFGAAWHRGWRLVGIGILPAIPVLLLIVGGVGLAGIFGPLAGLLGADALAGTRATLAGLIGLLACIAVPLALVLGVLQTFANRACMLEDLGVVASYQRGLSVLGQNIGSALILLLIQIAITIVLWIVLLVPGIIAALCCLLWPIALLVEGTVIAFFSTLWTLAWRRWTIANLV